MKGLEMVKKAYEIYQGKYVYLTYKELDKNFRIIKNQEFQKADEMLQEIVNASLLSSSDYLWVISLTDAMRDMRYDSLNTMLGKLKVIKINLDYIEKLKEEK